MTNHLREILKQILLQKGTEFQIGNYHVRAETSGKSTILKIYHVKYMGIDQFESAVWNETDHEIMIPYADICQNGEVVFILRSIKSVSRKIEKVYEVYPDDIGGVKKDVTSEYQMYL